MTFKFQTSLCRLPTGRRNLRLHPDCFGKIRGNVVFDPNIVEVVHGLGIQPQLPTAHSAL